MSYIRGNSRHKTDLVDFVWSVTPEANRRKNNTDVHEKGAVNIRFRVSSK